MIINSILFNFLCVRIVFQNASTCSTNPSKSPLFQIFMTNFLVTCTLSVQRNFEEQAVQSINM